MNMLCLDWLEKVWVQAPFMSFVAVVEMNAFVFGLYHTHKVIIELTKVHGLCIENSNWSRPHCSYISSLDQG